MYSVRGKKVRVKKVSPRIQAWRSRIKPRRSAAAHRLGCLQKSRGGDEGNGAALVRVVVVVVVVIVVVVIILIVFIWMVGVFWAGVSLGRGVIHGASIFGACGEGDEAPLTRAVSVSAPV